MKLFPMISFEYLTHISDVYTKIKISLRNGLELFRRHFSKTPFLKHSKKRGESLFHKCVSRFLKVNFLAFLISYTVSLIFSKLFQN